MNPLYSKLVVSKTYYPSDRSPLPLSLALGQRGCLAQPTLQIGTASTSSNLPPPLPLIVSCSWAGQHLLGTICTSDRHRLNCPLQPLSSIIVSSSWAGQHLLGSISTEIGTASASSKLPPSLPLLHHCLLLFGRGCLAQFALEIGTASTSSAPSTPSQAFVCGL